MVDLNLISKGKIDNYLDIISKDSLNKGNLHFEITVVFNCNAEFSKS
jgi:hypothetical protein